MASVVYPGLPRPVDIAGIFNATDQGYKAGQDWRDERIGQKQYDAYVDAMRSAQGASQALAGGAPAAQPSQPDYPTQRVASAFGDASGPLNGYYSALRSAESSGNDAAANPNSSATGRYQFTKGTWDGLMTAHPELGLTPAGVTDPNQQERAVRALTAQNAKALSGAGIKVNPGNLYAAHFLGAGGAGKVLSAPDNAPVSALVSPEVVQANPQLANMTVGDFKQWTASKVGGGAPTAPQGVQVADASGGIPALPSADPASILPPPEVMKGLFRSKITRPLAISLAQAAIKLRADQSDPMAKIEYLTAVEKLKQLRNPTEKPTSDMQNYEFYSAQEKAAGRQPLSYNDWNLQSKRAGATTINNSVSAGGDFSKQLQKNVADNVLEQRVGAQDAADLIKIINEGRGILDSGAITGAGANYKVGALKLAGAMGIPIPQGAADNTQAFRAVMGQAVGKIIKQFGSGTGLSDADRQYAERIAGGDVTLNEEAIRRILDIADKAARGRIKAWQQKVPEVLKGDMGSMLNVQMPDAYSPPAASGAPQPGQVEDGFRFKGGNPSDPNSWEPVQ